MHQPTIHLPIALAAVLAIWSPALSAQALTKTTYKAVKTTPAKPAPAAKPAAPMPEATPVQPMEVAKPSATEKKECCEEHGKPAMGDKKECCEEHAAAGSDKKECCEEHAAAGSDKKECCKEHGAMGGDKKECCEGEGEGMQPGKGHHPHGMGGMHGRMAHHGNAWRGHEVRYMPAMAGGNQYVVVANDRRMAFGNWGSMGMQGNLALQLAPAGGLDPWLTPYGGILPRVGFSLGGFRADLGSLAGVGLMMRTATVPGAGKDFFQVRPIWAIEPRLEIGWKGERFGAGLVGTYLLTPYQADMGGPTAGLRITFKQHPW